MKTYADIIELLTFEGPGLQDYVTPAELDQLIDGSLAPAVIADRYLDDLDGSTLVSVETDTDETRADALAWIRSEIEIAIEQRNEDARDDALASLAEFAAAEDRLKNKVHGRRMALIAKAQEAGNTKDSIAKSLGISRPTLNQWLTDQHDRALFNEVLFLVSKKADLALDGQRKLVAALGIRDTSVQAATLINALDENRPDGLTSEQAKLVTRAEERARQVI